MLAAAFEPRTGDVHPAVLCHLCIRSRFSRDRLPMPSSAPLLHERPGVASASVPTAEDAVG